MHKISIENIGDVKKYVWHYRKDNKEYGPFTYEDIVEMARKGEIGPEDYLLKFGNRKFFKASEVQGLFEGIAEPEAKQEEQASAPEVQIAADAEEPKEDIHMIFENRTVHNNANQKRESTGSKLIMIAAGLLGLGLAALVLILLF